MNKNLATREGNGNMAVAERTRDAVTYTPRFDILEMNDELILCGDLPGVTRDDLEIRFEQGELIINAPVAPRHGEREFVYGEYGIGNFHRSFAISETIDAEKISARSENGVLFVTIPKKEEVKPKRIDVKIG